MNTVKMLLFCYHCLSFYIAKLRYIWMNHKVLHLFLRSKFGFKVACHLGPTGALRIPIQQFSETMIQFLEKQVSRNRDEYELM